MYLLNWNNRIKLGVKLASLQSIVIFVQIQIQVFN